MLLLHVTDFHFRRRWYDWLAREARHYDAVAFSGDLRDLFPNVRNGLYEQARWVRDWLQDFPVPLFVCTGNHDCWTSEIPVNDPFLHGGWIQQAARPGVCVDRTNIFFGGHRIICTPWAEAPLVPGSDPTILVVHSPPFATSISSDLGRDVGDPDVTSAVLQLPAGSLVLSGHVHHPARWHCRLGAAWCFNPGVDFTRDEPNHIIIDTTHGTATFRGFGQAVRLVRLAP